MIFKLKRWFFTVTGMKFTSETWSKIFHEITILDPDGWDRSPDNFDFEWCIELITIEEYMSRVMKSTIKADMRLWE